MADTPTNLADYHKRFLANQGAEGFEMETAALFPCPFCAAPRWAVVPITSVAETLAKPHHCGECGRSARMISERTPQGIAFEVVQTGGPDQPDWLMPKMRRESELPGLGGGR